MKTFILILSLLISGIIYSQNSKPEFIEKKEENTWLTISCPLQKNIDNDTLNVYPDKSNLVPHIKKQPKKFNYKIASHFSLNGLTKLVFYID